MLAIHPACTASRPSEGKTNVILVTIDALRADSLPFAGHPHVESVHLDRFAANSIVFTEAISSFVGTTAAMPSLMTGPFPSFEDVDRWNPATYYGFSDLNDPDERKGLTRNVHTLPEILQSAGYVTAGFNTNPLLTSKFNFHQGFMHYAQFGDFYRAAIISREYRLEANYSLADVVVDAVLQWLDTTSGPPFFLWFHLMDPHCPYRMAFISSINFGVARTKAWKYRRIKKPFGEHLPGELLFHIANDPLEKHDVAQQHPEQLLALRERYDAFAQQLRQRGRSLPASSEEGLELDPETAERLRGLGYLGE